MFIVKSNTCEIPIITKIKKCTKSKKNNLLQKNLLRLSLGKNRSKYTTSL